MERTADMQPSEKLAELDSIPPVDSQSIDFLRKMASLIPGIIYVFNHQKMSNEYSNRSIAELLGYTPQELIDMGDEIIEKCVHEDDLPGLVDYFKRITEVPDGEYISFEYRDYAKNGDIVWLRSIDTPFERAADGSVLRHIGIAFDITAEKKAELALRKLNTELETRVANRTHALETLNDELEARVDARTVQLLRANRELEQLSFVATHDLKVPINNMSSLTEMLEEARDTLPPEHGEVLDWMRLVCEQASQKLDALVNVAQANVLRNDPFSSVNLQAIFERVIGVNQSLIREANALVRADFNCAEVFFLEAEVENIFEALLLNALMYRADDRRAEVAFRSFRSDEGVTVTVADNGSGFDARDDMNKVFGLFQRAHVFPPGAGVSLYTIKRIMEQIGGSIDAESRRNVGSTFTLFFPKAQKQMGQI